jgi:hypothetical protein
LARWKRYARSTAPGSSGGASLEVVGPTFATFEV